MRPELAESTLTIAVIFLLVLQATPPAPAARDIDDPAVPLTGSVPQGSYEQNLRGAVARAQSLQGPLDGAWILSDADGRALYRLQFVDRGLFGDAVEGAWLDLSGGGRIGLVERIFRDAERLSLAIESPPGPPALVTLQGGPSGYAGEMIGGGGPPRTVRLRRP